MNDVATRSNMAKSLMDMVTAKQLGFIRALGREMRIDPENECQAIMHCATSELSKRAASDFIDHLQQMQRRN